MSYVYVNVNFIGESAGGVKGEKQLPGKIRFIVGTVRAMGR